MLARLPPAWAGAARIGVPGLAAVLPSLVHSAVVPPVYADLTITGVILTPAAIMPHYPPFYAYFLWAVNGLADVLCPGDGGLSNCGLYATVVLQHAVFSLGVLYFAVGCAQSIRGRVLAILPFYLVPVFMFVNHGVQTEALWLSCLVLLVGASYRIVMGLETRVSPHMVVFAAALVAVMIRPMVLFVAPLLPLALLLRLLVERRWAVARSLALAVGILAGAAVGGEGIFRTAMVANNLDYRSPWGRGAIEVLQRIVWRLESEDEGRASVDRDALIPPLEAATSDARLRSAVPTIVRFIDRTYDGSGVAYSWGGAHLALIRSGVVNGAGETEAVDLAEADRLINSFCILFMRTYPGLMLESTARTLGEYVRLAYQPGCEACRRALLTGQGYSFSDDAVLAQQVALTGMMDPAWLDAYRAHDLSIVRENAAAVQRYEDFLSSAYLHAIDQVRVLHGVLLLLGLTALTAWRRVLPARQGLFLVAGFAAMGVYLFAVSLLLAGLLRYFMLCQFFLVLLIGTVLGRLGDGRTLPRRESTVVPAPGASLLAGRGAD